MYVCMCVCSLSAAVIESHTLRRYFLCRMRALSTDINMCSREIAEAVWMPIDDFLSPSTYILNRVALCLALGRPLPEEYVRDGITDEVPVECGLVERTMTSLVQPDKSFKVYHAASAILLK